MVPLLVTVRVSVFDPLVTVPKASVVGEKLTSVAVAVSGSCSVVCPFGSPVKFAVTLPATVPIVDVLGLKSTLNKHVWPVDSDVVPERLQAPLVIPVVLTAKLVLGTRLFKLSVPDPAYLNVILVLLLVVPTSWVLKVTELGENDSKLLPVPVMPINCGLVGSLS